MAVGTSSQVSAEVGAMTVLLPEKKEGDLRLKACSNVVSHIDTEAHHVCSLNLPTTASCKLGTWTTQRKTKGFRTSNLL